MKVWNFGILIVWQYDSLKLWQSDNMTVCNADIMRVQKSDSLTNTIRVRVLQPYNLPVKQLSRLSVWLCYLEDLFYPLVDKKVLQGVLILPPTHQVKNRLANVLQFLPE